MLLKFAIKDFVEDREFKNLSVKTIGCYKATLEEFREHCIDKEIVDVTDISSSIVKSYLIHCQKERKNQPASINHKLANLKVFFNYLEKELELFTAKGNPTRKITPITTETRIEVFSDAQIQQMLGYYRRTKQRHRTFFAYRETAIIITLLGTGMRLGELVNLRWNDVDLENCTIVLFGKKRQISTVPMTNKLKKELAEYRVYVTRHFGSVPEYVFTDSRGQQLEEDAVKNIFKRLKKVMNFKGVRLSCHTFRHTFAHRCLMEGMDIFTLQKMLRHSNLAMTQKYLALWGTALREQNEKFNPLNSIDL